MKDEMKNEEWEAYKREEEAKPKKKEGGLMGLFGKGSDIKMKLGFEMKRKYREQMHQIDLTKLLRAKIFNLQGDKEMSEEDIQMVKDAIQPYLIGFN
jgi:hypothetical protein